MVMSDILTCENCGAPFEDLGPGTRCPSCNARVSRGRRRREVSSEAEPEQRERESSFYFNSGTGFRAMGWQGGAGRGVLLAIAAVVLAPMLGVAGLVSLLLGALFDVSLLVTLGLVFLLVTGVALLLVGWKALAALRAARRMMSGMSSGYGASGGSRRDPADDDRIDGHWGSSDSP
jgi:hypothetical protein